MPVRLEEIPSSKSLLTALQRCLREKQDRSPYIAQPAAQLLGASGFSKQAYIV